MLCTGYKIYAEILRERLEGEIIRKKLLPESQGGFRKGRGTMDNIFILNHVVQREKCKGEKVYALFVDLKAAFDNVDRNKLWRILKDKGIEEQLISRIRSLYKETRVAIRTKEGTTDSFITKKGVRQGVLSPTLFNLYIAQVDKYFERKRIGGIKLGKERIWSLAYADDMVLLAKNREALLGMMEAFKSFCKDRELILNTEKTKLLIFNKKGRDKKEKWKWRGKEIEEVKCFKYLGFVFNRNGDYAEITHIRELKRKGRIALCSVWSLGERICRDDFGRRWKLFKYLIQSVITYGVEIWGWEEKKELEKIMIDYMR